MAELNTSPVADADFAAALEQIKALLAGGGQDMAEPAAMAPHQTATGAAPSMRRDPMAGVTVDWSEPQSARPRAPRPTAYASSAGNPLGDLIASYTNSNALGAAVSGGEDLSQGIVSSLYNMSGIPGGMEAGRNLAEAEASGDPIRGAAALGQGALATLPYNRLAGAAMRTLPGALASGAAFAGIPIAATTAFMPSEAMAQGRQRQPSAAPQPAGPPPDDGLQPEQRARRDDLNKQYTREQWLPPALRRELESLTKITTDYQTSRNAARTETDRTIALERAKLQAEEERQRSQAAESERLANTPLGKAHPWAPPALAAAGFALGSLGANAISRAGVRSYNTSINELNDRWATAIERGDRARTGAGRQAASTLADHLGDEFRTLQRQGAGGHWPSIGAAIAGTEVGLALPTFIDYTTSAPGSPLREHVTRSMSNPWELGGRMIGGAAVGAAAGEYASSIARSNISRPPGFRAETNALAGPGPQRLIGQGPEASPLPGQLPLPLQSSPAAPQQALPPPTAPPASSSSNALASPPPSAPRTSSTSTSEWPDVPGYRIVGSGANRRYQEVGTSRFVSRENLPFPHGNPERFNNRGQ